jgi:hypothetical protein
VRWLGGTVVAVVAAGGGAAWAVASPADRPAALGAASVPADPAPGGLAPGRESPRGQSPRGRSPSGPAQARPVGADGAAPAAGAGGRVVPPTGSAGPTVAPVPPVDWFAVLDGLDAARAAAYEAGDVELLRRVYAAGPHLAADSAQLRRIVAAGDTVRGVRHQLRVIAVLDRQPARVRLRVAQSLPASVRVRPGQPVTTIPGTPESTVSIELTLTRDGWRLA